MTSRITAALFAMAVAATPAARAADFGGDSLTIEGYAGWQNLNINSPANSIANAVNGNEGTALIGGDILAKISLLGIGLLLDKTTNSSGPWSGGLLLGVVFDVLPSFRLEGLGEGGRVGSSFGDMFTSSGGWFVGLRPGVSFRLLPTPIRFGVSGLVRWPESNGSLGSANWGIIGRVGFEIP